MTVSVTWSYSNGGAAITTDVDYGNASNGDTTDAEEIFVRHDGSNSITSVGLYIRAYSGTYVGSATAALDLTEFIGWGNSSTSSGFGGILINWNALGSYPSSSWSTYSSKAPTGGNVFRTGVGDSLSNAVEVPTSTGATAAGEIQAGSSPNVRFQLKIRVPTNEDTVGIRQFDLVLAYSYTS